MSLEGFYFDGCLWALPCRNMLYVSFVFCIPVIRACSEVFMCSLDTMELSIMLFVLILVFRTQTCLGVHFANCGLVNSRIRGKAFVGQNL